MAIDESVSLDVLYFLMKNIKSHDLEAMTIGRAKSKQVGDIACLFLLA